MRFSSIFPSSLFSTHLSSICDFHDFLIFKEFNLLKVKMMHQRQWQQVFCRRSLFLTSSNFSLPFLMFVLNIQVLLRVTSAAAADGLVKLVWNGQLSNVKKFMLIHIIYPNKRFSCRKILCLHSLTNDLARNMVSWRCFLFIITFSYIIL